MCDCILCRLRAFELKVREDQRSRPTVERETTYVQEMKQLLSDFDSHIGPIEHDGVLLQFRLAIVVMIEMFTSCLDYFQAEQEAKKNQFAA